MSVELKLDAEKRTDKGKGASRRLRRAKQLPAVLYGAGKEAVAIQVQEEQVLRLLREETFFSQIIDIKLGKQTEQALLKDMQRHPFKPLVSHLDFQRIKAGEKLTTHIPIHFLNEDKAKGVKEGGVIHHDMIEVEIECLPQDIPEFLEVDVLELEIGDSVHLSQVSVPEGVAIPSLSNDPEQDPTVVSIHAPRVTAEQLEEEAEEAAAEGAAAAGEEEPASGESESSDEESGDKE
ncbi:50S ribosomal protein L25/general stress protein Ctc [Ectothiorhodospiraceae bacterium WFHF3C12]|nr:50S ribosomal protein L25/general stress protein Ctc [Ectothiorhodospiraceae bacterium WFHF3C12]